MFKILAVLLAVCTASVCEAADVYSASKLQPVAASVEVNPFVGAYGGLTVGGQFTDITVGDNDREIFSGISADGYNLGGIVGYNFAYRNIVFGPYAEYGVSDVSVSVLGNDVLTMDDYAQLGAMVGVNVSKNTLVSVHIAREWDTWSAGNTDVDVAGWVFGGAIDTMVASQVSVGLVLDYVAFDSVEVDGGADLSGFLEDSDALRAKVRLLYRPRFELPKLY